MTGFDASSRETRSQSVSSIQCSPATLRLVPCKDMDTLSREKRSQNMAAIQNRDTGPEMLVRRYLWSKGIRYRLHPKNVPGNPDLVIRRFSLAIFVHGCFWHGHENCPRSRLPKSRVEFWSAKIGANKKRDAFVAERLERQGWRQLVIWDCQLRTQKAAAVALPRLLSDISSICSVDINPQPLTAETA